MTNHVRIYQLLAIVFTAAAYYICGRLGLMLAIPPGYATAVWPASGVALAAILILGWRVIPGILLGSFLVNVGTGLDTSSLTKLLLSLITPVTIALGATLQAALGGWLIKRFVGSGNILTQGIDIFRLMLLGGPVACFIAASVGVSTLWFTGAIADDGRLFSWLTWWVGDCIGVLIFTPLILVWAVRPYRTWIGQQLLITLPLLLLFSVVVTVFVKTSDREQARLEQSFNNRATLLTQNFRAELDRYRVALTSLGGLMSTPTVTHTEFQRFADFMLAELPGLHATSWNPVIRDSERMLFEQRMQREGLQDYQILELTEEGALTPAARRDEYVPIAYIRHAGNPDAVLGFDIASNAVRKLGLQQAELSRALSVTGKITLVGDAANSSAVLFFLPVFDPENVDHLLGYATLVIRLQTLMTVLTRYIPLEGVVVQLLDISGDAESQALAATSAGLRENNDSLIVDTPLRIGQRNWELRFTLPESYLLAHRSWQAWIALAAGLLLTTLLGMLLLTLVGRAARVELLVRERTAEVRESEARFRSLLESAPEAMVIVKADGSINLVNSRAEEIFGYTKADLVGQPVEQLTSAEFPNEYFSHRAGYAEDTQPRPLGGERELHGRRQDGSEFPIEISLSPLQIGMERVTTVTIRDITERKKAERQLNRALSVLSATLESTADGILVVDNLGKVVNFNQKWLQMWSIPAELHNCRDDERLLAAILPQLVDPDAFLERVQQLYKQPIQESNDLIYFKDGRVFERYSRPQRIGEEITGRVWSFRDITERKVAEARILQMAQQDALTKLPNRMLLMDRLEQAIEHARRAGNQVAVMMLDLDHFKHVNDSLGHHVGDELLLAVVERLKRCIRRSDTLARMGGDEFVVVLSDIKNKEDVTLVAMKMLAQLSKTLTVGTHELTATASIGICLYPDDGNDPNTLMKQADAAMYKAKEMGRGNFQWFNSEMLLAAEERLDLEGALRRALAHNEFVLQYQPVISVGRGQVVGMEALLRWQHPKRGMLGPESFIMLAEETGLIGPIGEWALRKACAEAKLMQEQMGAPLVISVNISSRQFRQLNLVDVVKSALSSSGLPANTLVLEITESVLATNTMETVKILESIRELGVRVAIDDFGTGYSSLSYITRFPIDILKIDQSFIRDIIDDENDAAIAVAIIAMAHSLGMEVIAEGVEKLEQLVFLVERGCDKAQGFYFSQAVAADKFVPLAEALKLNYAGCLSSEATGKATGLLRSKG